MEWKNRSVITANSHESMPDAKFESGSFSCFGAMTSQNSNIYPENGFNFEKMSIVFSLNFSLILIFRFIKPIIKLFSRLLFIGDHSSTFHLFVGKVIKFLTFLPRQYTVTLRSNKKGRFHQGSSGPHVKVIFHKAEFSARSDIFFCLTTN